MSARRHTGNVIEKFLENVGKILWDEVVESGVSENMTTSIKKLSFESLCFVRTKSTIQKPVMTSMYRIPLSRGRLRESASEISHTEPQFAWPPKEASEKQSVRCRLRD